MIRIKDYILNENELLGIVYIKEENKLELISKDKFSEFIENATFEDIEWNYGNNISESLSYDLAKAKIEELEEKNKTFEDYNKDLNNQLYKLEDDLDAEKSTNANLSRRILKAIKYLNLKVDLDKNHLEEAIKDMEEDLLKILGGEENDNN